jgi:hypothetical protein
MEVKSFIAYKGFDKNLKCKEEQFEIGGIYTKPHKLEPKLCSDEGWHFCKTLREVDTYYPFNKDNRYCKIIVMGPHSYSGDKGITTRFKILEELTQEQVDSIILERTLHLSKIREIQSIYPEVIIGGSIALALQGYKLNRVVRSGTYDVDIIIPHFSLFEKLEKNPSTSSKSSGNDFDYNIMVKGLLLDVRIDNKATYKIVKFGEHTYKVANVLDILEAKIRYARAGGKSGSKHEHDIYNLMNGK